MSATTWVCAQVGSKLECLGRTWAAVNFRGGATLAVKNVNLGFGYLPYVQRFSARARFGEEEARMGLSGSSRSRLEAPAEHE